MEKQRNGFLSETLKNTDSLVLCKRGRVESEQLGSDTQKPMNGQIYLQDAEGKVIASIASPRPETFAAHERLVASRPAVKG
jgi:hypothetical protein